MPNIHGTSVPSVSSECSSRCERYWRWKPVHRRCRMSRVRGKKRLPRRVPQNNLGEQKNLCRLIWDTSDVWDFHPRFLSGQIEAQGSLLIGWCALALQWLLGHFLFKTWLGTAVQRTEPRSQPLAPESLEATSPPLAFHDQVLTRERNVHKYAVNAGGLNGWCWRNG